MAAASVAEHALSVLLIDGLKVGLLLLYLSVHPEVLLCATVLDCLLPPNWAIFSRPCRLNWTVSATKTVFSAVAFP